MVPTGPSLVDDLIPVILEMNDDHWWPRDFQRFALISSAWVGPIRRRLYSCPSIRTFCSCTLLVRTLSENVHMQSLVQGIDLRPIAELHDHAGILSEKDMASLRYILSIRGLQSLTLGGELAADAERFIHMMANTRAITSLHIDGNYIRSRNALSECMRPASLEWDEVIAFKFPKLRSLRLSNLELAIAHPSIPYILHLTDVSLDNVEVVDGVLQDLCYESWDSVRSLSVVGKSTFEFDEQLRWMLECCENLESFQYEIYGIFGNQDMFDDDFSPLPSLRKMQLSDVNVNPHSLVSIGQCCTGLEELTVSGRSVRITPDDWAAFIRSGALPALRTLRTSSGTNVPPFSFWSKEMRQQVWDACIARNITLACCAPIT